MSEPIPAETPPERAPINQLQRQVFDMLIRPHKFRRAEWDTVVDLARQPVPTDSDRERNALLLRCSFGRGVTDAPNPSKDTRIRLARTLGGPLLERDGERHPRPDQIFALEVYGQAELPSLGEIMSRGKALQTKLVE